MSNPPHSVSHPLHKYKEDCMLMNKTQTFSISPLVKISFTFTTNSKSHVLLEQALRQNPQQMAIVGKRPLSEHRHCALKKKGGGVGMDSPCGNRKACSGHSF